MQLEKFKKSQKKRNILLILGILILLGGSIILYKTYALYQEEKRFNVLKGSVPNFETKSAYKESILNGADPVLVEGLIPVNIANDGTVTKADTTTAWYSYENKIWANAVILKEKEVATIKDTSGNGNDGIVNGNITEGYGYTKLNASGSYILSGIDSSTLSNNYAIALKFQYQHIGKRQTLFMGNAIHMYIENNGEFVISFKYTTDSDTIKYYTIRVSTDYFVENQVYNFLMNRNDSEVVLYSDGEVIGSTTISHELTLARQEFIIGYDSSSSPYFIGKYFYIAIATKNLSAEEIKKYYIKEKIENKEDLLLEYKFYDVYNEEMGIIEEDNIESYFVWIPKYSYQLWDLGEYSTLTEVDTSKVQTINVKFGVSNTSDSVNGECSTPGTSGESGNCVVGDYMTHPAFLAFNTNGLWVGKFETGYSGATSTNEARVNSSDASKIIVKPNVYSWRSIQVSNAYMASYNYERSLESHMMKNTEWGAAAYLSHSIYGINTEVRINNNSAYITGYAAVNEPTCGYTATNEECNKYESTVLGVDGTYTINYLNPNSVVASTTGNISGVYDMSGGAWEYMMSVMLDSTNTTPLSGRNNVYNSGFNGPLGCPTCDSSTVSGVDSSITSITNGVDFPTDSRYYDTYTYATNNKIYQRRILGDATGEMGPFATATYGNQSRQIGSWYDDYSHFVYHSVPWFARGYSNYSGVMSGIFAFTGSYGATSSDATFRVVLAI